MGRLVKNTWSHSAVLVLVAALVLVACRALAGPAAHTLAGLTPHPSAALSAFGAPLVTLAQLVPGLVLGWFTRRHPLLVGAAAGILATVASQWLPILHLEPYSLIGQTVAVAFTVAVAALAGRALRYRFRPTSVPTTGGARY